MVVMIQMGILARWLSLGELRAATDGARLESRIRTVLLLSLEKARLM